MNNSKPLLSISIYYQGHLKFKIKLLEKLAAYASRMLRNQYEPFIDISLYDFDS